MPPAIAAAPRCGGVNVYQELRCLTGQLEADGLEEGDKEAQDLTECERSKQQRQRRGLQTPFPPMVHRVPFQASSPTSSSLKSKGTVMILLTWLFENKK